MDDEMTPFGVRLGDWVRRRRTALGLTQEQIAERIDPDLETNWVTQLENRRKKGLPAQPRLGQIARAFRMSEIDMLREIGVITEEPAISGIAEASPRYDPDDPHARLMDVIAELPDDYVEDVVDLAKSVKRSYERRTRSIEAPHVPNDRIEASAFYANGPSGLGRM